MPARGWSNIAPAMKKIFILLCLAGSARAQTAFAPGAIPTTDPINAGGAFTPDGDTVYYFRRGQGADTTLAIVFSRKDHGAWTPPQVASFSGRYTDLEPSLSPDGSYMVFSSNRPTTPGGGRLDGRYNGKSYTGGGGNLWRVDRTPSGWGEPWLLGPSINADSSVFSPCIAPDGSLYFMKPDSGKAFHLYRASVGGTSEPLPFSRTAYGDFDPAVGPGEAYVVFSSPRPSLPDSVHKTHLFIVFRTPQGWTEPLDLRSAFPGGGIWGVEAHLSPDGKTLYYANVDVKVMPMKETIWSLDLTALLKEHGIG